MEQEPRHKKMLASWIKYYIYIDTTILLYIYNVFMMYSMSLFI